MRPDVYNSKPMLMELMFLMRRSLEFQFKQVRVSIPGCSKYLISFQTRLLISLMAYKSELVNNVGDKRENMVKRDTCFVRNPSNYKKFFEADNNSGFKENNIME